MMGIWLTIPEWPSYGFGSRLGTPKIVFFCRFAKYDENKRFPGLFVTQDPGIAESLRCYLQPMMTMIFPWSTGELWYSVFLVVKSGKKLVKTWTKRSRTGSWNRVLAPCCTQFPTEVTTLARKLLSASQVRESGQKCPFWLFDELSEPIGGYGKCLLVVICDPLWEQWESSVDPFFFLWMAKTLSRRTYFCMEPFASFEAGKGYLGHLHIYFRRNASRLRKAWQVWRRVSLWPHLW